MPIFDPSRYAAPGVPHSPARQARPADDPPLIRTAAEALRELSHFTAAGSGDPAKTDLELTCQVCGARVCDVEAGDGLDVLASAALDHQHAGETE